MKKIMEQTFENYGPTKLADILFKNNILNPVHYYIMRTLKDVKESYQSLVLYEMLIIDFQIPSQYLKFKNLVKMESSLIHISSVLTHVGKV